MSTPSYKTFSDFYPFYLNEHRSQACKVSHFIGTSLVLCVLIISFAIDQRQLLWFLPIFGYGFAWIGHFFFEKNRPATFKYPFFSLAGDFVMYWHLLTGRLSFQSNATLKT